VTTDEELARSYQRETETARRQGLADWFHGIAHSINYRIWYLTKLSLDRSVDVWV
jgi:hypothetical protein